MQVDLPRDRLELGLGLLSIGRIWGATQSEPPGEAEAEALLERALALGIRIFDTAPAYAASEARLGRFLAGLPRARRDALVVMTKAGEHWDPARGSTIVDHGRDALRRSLDRSFELLGSVDVLQIHKATAANVTHPNVVDLIDHAKACGVPRIGASVSDVAAGRAAIGSGLYDVLQFPFNATVTTFEALLQDLRGSALVPVINRPFAMGALAPQAGEGRAGAESAFRFIEEHVRAGVVLTGTGSPRHLEANVAGFRTRMSGGP